MDDAHQIKTLTETFPHRWRHGQRDSVESLATVMAYARDFHLYRKCGCTTWNDFCQRYFDGEAAGFNELIDGVRILQRDHWRGPISEADARNAVERARQEAKTPENKPGGRRVKPYIKIESGGTGASYRLRRLARLKPEVLDAYERGEFRSVDAAFRHAFALNDLRRAWTSASPEDREAFRAEITE